MSGMPDSGHGWAICEYTPYTRRYLLDALLAEALAPVEAFDREAAE
jgi:hypothetical protein